MLAYFPSIYPSELLYSVLARYHLHMGLPPVALTLESLFGNRKTVAAFDLPGNLQALANRIPPQRKLTVAYMIEHLTLVPYYLAFQPPAIQETIRQAIAKGEIEGVYLRLGLAAFRINRVNRLRFCHQCLDVMQVQHGELYWRRDHQLDSVLVCPDHGVVLQESIVSISSQSRHEFVAATRINCPFNAPSVLINDKPNQKVLKHLHRLAIHSANLLKQSVPSRSFASWTSFYRNQMVSAGLSKSMVTMNQPLLNQEFRSYYGQSLDYFPGVLEDNEFTNDWLASMVRKHRKANHPLYHLLLRDFLDQHVARQPIFGHGPWPCLNPLADHYGSLQIKAIQQHANHGKTVGVFSCDCGYVYTRWFYQKTGQLGSPRFQNYGPLLEPVLRDLVSSGTALRKTARMLQLDPKTVVRLADDLGISTPWKSKPYKKKVLRAVVHKSTKTAPVPNLIKSHPSANRLARKDWKCIDREWVIKLKKLEHAIRKKAPPVRVTLAELERRADKKGWILKRTHKLPHTMTYLGRIVETTEDFQSRRIDWAITQLDESNFPVVAWRVMRMAGLKPTSSGLVQIALENRILYSQKAA
ncbi:TnsD family Tn7-like transposition protein [Methylotenera sp.]|uniref:TnsD family Tn7-like transposition protein n=1 Tax=Methylotenera sp. TaxID=2051956 RepID=UPI00345111D8